MLVYDCNLNNQHSLVRNFSKRWFGPYVVKQAYDNATYLLQEVDGTKLQISIAGKRIKLFCCRGEDPVLEDSEDFARKL
jgi:hypothetical protein